ncbi:hypothetical protein ACFFGT_32565 [Mucilaginibacter angelicae]|uniref:Uncharacterized protein n=1 Tax=Mucilaginibacter angelicae TaxID=869718 RepID=A0ABV6LHP0_9SPHI
MIKIFKYLDELNCFMVDNDYKRIADQLGLTEWNEVVWIGRFFILDNDYGEHWFDNWPERELIEDKAKIMGYDSTELFVIDHERFKDNRDGPCHSPDERVRFWTDVLKSLHLSYETLFAEARKQNREREKLKIDSGYIPNLEERIAQIAETASYDNLK